MQTYLIGYNLNRPEQNGEELIKAIKGISDTWRHQFNFTWIIKTNISSTDIRNALADYLNPDDELLVVKLHGDSSWIGIKEEAAKWLRENILSS